MKRITQTRWFEIILLALIGGLTYLPRIGELTYYRDDWYFLYNALVNGPRVFVDIALHTRPIRGPLYMLYYSLFGLNPFPWHVTMFLTRLASGIGALWLFNLIWPNRRQANFFMAALFLLFPGFLWWVSGFEFQPYVLSVALQAFSIAFTLKAIAADSVPQRLGWTVAAMLSGWAYLALVEYAIGMEVFRLLCVYLHVQRNTPQWKFIPSFLKTLRVSALHLTIPVVFVLWYQFLFDNWRRAQDAGAQLGRLFDSPLTILWRLVDLARSFLNVSIFAWIVPFYQNFYANRLRDILLGLVFAALVIFLVWVAHRFITPHSDQGVLDADPSSNWQTELIWVGLLGTLAGVLPIVLANRVVTFERISQYTLPASMTGVLFLGGLLYSVSHKRVREILLGSILGLAVLSHHGLAAQAVKEEKTISDFWWQVVWRAPDLKPGTTLVVLYPGITYGDGNDVVWGPANFIYAPEHQGRSPVTVPIAGSRLETDSILDIINGKRDFQQTDLIIKNTAITYNYKNLLILSQPSESACVHAIDPRWRELSLYDQPFLYAGYQNSKIENIIVNDEEAPMPPLYSFGAELPHEWCYYYQKANLARQQADWPQVAKLGDEAQKLGLHPNDQIEWIPFLQAYALLDDLKQVRAIAKRINTEPFYQDQACQNLEALAAHGDLLSAEMQNKVDELFCQ